MCSRVEKTNEMKGEGKGLKNEDNGRNKIEKNLSFPPNIHRVVTMIRIPEPVRTFGKHLDIFREAKRRLRLEAVLVSLF